MTDSDGLTQIPRPTATRPLLGMTVLVVEDDLLNRMFYNAVLEGNGYETVLVDASKFPLLRISEDVRWHGQLAFVKLNTPKPSNVADKRRDLCQRTGCVGDSAVRLLHLTKHMCKPLFRL